MPGCLDQAEWVHGTPMVSEDQEIYPWELCSCCHQSVIVADKALADAGIPHPEEVMWCLESTRVRVQRLTKLEGLKK